MAKAVVLTICALISTAWAYSAGAPESTCDDMTPKHPVDPQSSEFPYKVQVDKDDVKGGEEVQITIVGKPFKGFLLQVRDGKKAVGQFLIEDSDKYFRTVDCHDTKGSGATHKNATDKKDIVLKWRSPEKKGEYQVYATVAQDGGTFWVRQPTAIIKVN